MPSPPVSRSCAATGLAPSGVAQGTSIDLAIGIALISLTAALLLPSDVAAPMNLWDESRNANNAIEMAANGNWLVTMFNGVPDHWNTKPPLLIWIIAALLKSGMPPLLAVRLPSALATAATVLTLYFVCRLRLHDRLAGLVSCLLVYGSTLFLGPHVARTGDYDALLSLLVLIQVLAFECYVASPVRASPAWIVGAAVALTLAVLTKGIAGLLVVPGMLSYAVVRRQLLRLLGDVRIYAAALAVLGACTSYYAGRELFDPGYLHAVWQNELGGRYVTALTNSESGSFYYIEALFLRFSPGLALLPFTVLPLFGGSAARYGIVLICLLASASLLLIVTTAATRLFWYAAPAVPLLSLSAGIALADGVTSLARHRSLMSATVNSRIVKTCLATALSVAIATWLNRENNAIASWTERFVTGQSWYGDFLATLRADGITKKLLIVDGGVTDDDGLQDGYRPIADFYRKDAASHDQAVGIASPGSRIADGTWIVTCDARVREQMSVKYVYTIMRSNRWCELGLVGGHAIGADSALPGTKG